jgi:transglutaminase-like putative cysteine protease
MFLVEIEAGREALYDSVDALTEAIHRREVGPQSRIFHRASSSWISITLHPEFKKAAAFRDSQPLPPLARTQWTFFGAEAKGREIDETPVKKSEAKQPAGKTSERLSGLRGLLRRAFRNRAPVPNTSETSGS